MAVSFPQRYLDGDTQPSARDEWRLLSLLNLFRTSVASTFTLLYLMNKLLPPLGNQDPLLFFKASALYLLLSMVLWFFLITRNVAFTTQVYASAIVDTLIITVLMHSSGGIESGLGVLLVVTLAASTIVLSHRSALGLAAFATLVILFQQFYSEFDQHKHTSYPIAGLLGFTYFATTMLVHALARRIRESEALAEQRGVDLANLAQLTQHIIKRMQTGVLVIDSGGMLRLINDAAAKMLSIDMNSQTIDLAKRIPALAEQWLLWRDDPHHHSKPVHIAALHIDVMPRFAQISDAQEGGTLIFLQDMAALAQQAQQLQLASLGRLSASIAHEIRNPLGAISHAGQLLAESEALGKHDKRLTEIIIDHSQRLNTIVENVMGISRRRPSQIELFALKEFLQRFISDYAATQNIDHGAFHIEVSPQDIQIRFDITHLRQILINLCDNAWRHSKHAPGGAKIRLRAGMDPTIMRPFLDIIDNGPGVSAEAIAHLFEPFFTTATTGTGLGLYLSRELAEANQANLNYISSHDEPAMFRLTFQDPRRQFE